MKRLALKSLIPFEGNIIHQTITPRSFEAIAYRTVQVLLKGEYRGVLEPWKHYLPLERDFSNIDKIVSYLSDDEKLQEIADLAYADIIDSNLYSSSVLGQGVDGVVDLIRNFQIETIMCGIAGFFSLNNKPLPPRSSPSLRHEQSTCSPRTRRFWLMGFRKSFCWSSPPEAFDYRLEQVRGTTHARK